MKVRREIENAVLEAVRHYPVLTITGPRQSGKSTLVKMLFPDYRYVSLEDPDVREMAHIDPRSFINTPGKGLVLDEIQRVPELTSYIQTIVDEDSLPGRFILTGSHQFELMNSISQSLAGRTAIFTLLPFTLSELKQLKKKQTLDSRLREGFYPGIHDRKLEPAQAYKNYFETYIERDLRQLIKIKDLRQFRKFVKLCAGRIGSLFSASSLASEVGVSVPTIQSWISILEASYILMFLEPYHANIGKRLIKSPKLYFYDVGLAAYLLGIETDSQMERDPLKGSLYENMVLMEFVKKRLNMGKDHNLNFYRDSNNNEVDIIYRVGRSLVPVEVKSSSTFNPDFLKGLRHVKKIFGEDITRGFLVYSGKHEQELDGYSVINYEHAGRIIDDNQS